MRRGESPNDEETDTDTVDDDVTESEESAANRKLQFLGIPLYKLSYKRLPKRCIKFSFLTLNGATFVRISFFSFSIVSTVYMIQFNFNNNIMDPVRYDF